MMEAEQLLETIVIKAQTATRVLVGIAGPPGAGKSTFAESLHTQLQQRGVPSKVVPMDGFHLDNHILDARGLRQRKGAPNTFDSSGFVELVKRLKVDSDTVPYPTFDRGGDCVVPDGDSVKAEHAVLLIEGNYLLLRDDPWCQLAPLFDLTAMLNPGLPVLEQRLIQRWLDHGHTADAAHSRAHSNDIPNAKLVVELSSESDVLIR